MVRASRLRAKGSNLLGLVDDIAVVSSQCLLLLIFLLSVKLVRKASLCYRFPTLRECLTSKLSQNLHSPEATNHCFQNIRTQQPPFLARCPYLIRITVEPKKLKTFFSFPLHYSNMWQSLCTLLTANKCNRTWRKYKGESAKRVSTHFNH